VADSSRRNDVADVSRKRNIRRRNAIRSAFKDNPEALQAMTDLFGHSAAEMSKADDNLVRVWLGHQEVVETLSRIDAMEHEDV
jgi:uncharacterized protein (DUF2461 family)